MIRYRLFVYAAVFGTGAVLNWDGAPQAAGAMALLALACTALMVFARPRPHRRPKGAAMTDSDEEGRRALEDIVSTINEFGPFRLQGQLTVLCPLCKTWCDAELTAGTGPSDGVSIVFAPSSAVIQLHADLSGHVHDHECPGANQTLAKAIRSRGQ